MSDKKGFYFLFDEWPMIEQLPDAQLAKLIRAIVKYEMTGEAVPLPPLANVAFLSIKGRLERVEATRAKKSAAGKKGMESRYGKSDITDDNDAIVNDDVITSDNTTIVDTSTLPEVITVDSTDREKARELWQQGRQIKDIAVELGVPPATVSSWKRRDQWAAVV